MLRLWGGEGMNYHIEFKNSFTFRDEDVAVLLLEREQAKTEG